MLIIIANNYNDLLFIKCGFFYSSILDELLSILTANDETSMVAIGAINNLALGDKYVIISEYYGLHITGLHYLA